MEKNSILCHNPSRVVSFNETNSPYAIVSVPKSFLQHMQIKKGTHKARLTCYQVVESTFCKVSLFSASGAHANEDVVPIHTFTTGVIVTGTNIFVKIPSFFVITMDIHSQTHRIDWTCMQNGRAFGIVRKKYA